MCTLNQTASLNQAIGLNGNAGFSSFDGTVTDKKKTIQNLEGQFQKASEDLITEQAKLTQIASERGGCKRTIGWNNSCLSSNTRAQEQANANITNLSATVARLQSQIQSERTSLAALTKAEADAEAARKEAEAKLVAANGNANPDVIKSQLEAQKLLSQQQIEGANSRTMIYFTGAFFLMAVIGVTIYFLKK